MTFPYREKTIGLVLLCLGLLSLPAHGQFDSGSSGADGALTFACAPGGETIEWDAAGLDPENDNIFHFTTVDIPADCTIVLKSEILGQEPIVWLAQGNVTIDGTVDLSGQIGHANTVGTPRLPALPGPGGFAGGLGTVNGIGSATNGLGPGAGKAAGRGGGAGHGANGVAFFFGTNGLAYGTTFLRPLLGGSGGGGAGDGGGGGAGGGAILIASTTEVAVDGEIRARGGAAGTGFAGSGSGGAIRVAAPIVSGAGILDVRGDSAGQDSAAGRIRIETDDYQYGGSTFSAVQRIVTLADTTILVSPNDPAFPTLRVVSVDGVPVPPNPTGGFNPADVTIDNANPVDIAIEAENVPVGTTVTVQVHNESTGTTNIVSPPLSGTDALSTATATGIVDAGFSSVTLMATFTP